MTWYLGRNTVYYPIIPAACTLVRNGFHFRNLSLKFDIDVGEYLASMKQMKGKTMHTEFQIIEC